MVRTQIQITEEQSSKLKQLAQEKNVSIAKLIRLSIDNLIRTNAVLDYEERKRIAIKAASKKFYSGQTDISTNHDKYFVESLEL